MSTEIKFRRPKMASEVKYDNGVATVKHRGRMTMINMQVTAEGILDGYPIRPTKMEQIAFAAAYLKLLAELEQAKSDTTRYRWLRDPRNQLHEDDISVSDSSFNAYFGDDLDAIIDAYNSQEVKS